MPAAFVPPYFTTTELWAPIDMPTLLSDIRTRRTLTVLARRAPGASADDVAATLASSPSSCSERHPTMHGGKILIARPLREELVGTARPALIATAAGALLLLLIVGANIAGLSTAQAVAARHQVAVRAALGATRMRLFVEQLVDGVVLAIVGVSAGIWIAYGLVQVVARYQEFFLARMAPISLDGVTIAAGVTAGLVIGLLAALLPRSVIGAAPEDALRVARGGTADVRVTAARSALVVAQMAIAIVLIIGAGLLFRTVQHLAQRDLGFVSDGLTWLQVTLSGPRYQSQDRRSNSSSTCSERAAYSRRAVGRRLGRLPAVGRHDGRVGDAWRSAGHRAARVSYLSVSPNFVTDIGARIVAGRDLLPSDHAGATRVVVINETMARLFWPAGDALGAQVQIGPGSPSERWITVVGIMADMRAHGVAEPIRPTAFGTTRQYSWPRRHIAVRSSEAASIALATELKSAIHAVDPAISLGAMTTSERTLANSLARHRLMLLALVVFGAVALVLCVSGLYAVIVLNSQQRRRDMRFALRSARGRAALRMVVRQALALSGLGAATGLLAAAIGTRVLQGLLHGVQPLDVTTFTTAGVALIVLATLAAWQPARHAERVDPSRRSAPSREAVRGRDGDYRVNTLPGRAWVSLPPQPRPPLMKT